MNTQEEVLHQKAEVLLDEWRDFVRECEAGYAWNVYEYHNDLSIRDRIQAALDDDQADDPGFPANVAQIDERFRALLQPGVVVGPEDGPWWHRGVLRYAGPDLASELKDWFQVDVEVREAES